MNLVRNNLSYLALPFYAFCLALTACVNSNVNPSAVNSTETIELELPQNENVIEDEIITQAISRRDNANAYSSVFTFEGDLGQGEINCEIRDAVEYCQERIQSGTNVVLGSRSILYQQRYWLNEIPYTDDWLYVPEGMGPRPYRGLIDLTIISKVVEINKKLINSTEFYEIQFEYEPNLFLEAVVTTGNISNEIVENAIRVNVYGILLISTDTHWLHSETFEFSLQGEESLAFSGSIEFTENLAAVDFPLPLGEQLFGKSQRFLEVLNEGDFDQVYEKISFEGQKEVTLEMISALAEWGGNALKFDALTISDFIQHQDEEDASKFYYQLTLIGESEGVVIATYQFIFEEESVDNWKILGFDIFLPEGGADL